MFMSGHNAEDVIATKVTQALYQKSVHRSPLDLTPSSLFLQAASP